MSATPYVSSMEHILDEMELLDIRLKFLVSALENNNINNNNYPSLFISDEQIELLLNKGTNKITENDSDFGIFLNKIKTTRNNIDTRKEATYKTGTRLNLDHVSQIFSLSSFETEILLICLAPEIDLKYEKIYSYLQDDISKVNPSINLILNLMGVYPYEERINHRKYFLPWSNLIKFKIIDVDTLSDKSYHFFAHTLKLNENIINFLLGFNQLDSQIEDFSRLYTKEQLANLDIYDIYESIKTRITDYISYSKSNQNSSQHNTTIFYLHGSQGMGKKTAILSLCNEQNLQIIVMDISKVIDSNLSYEKIMDILKREKTMHNAILYLDNFDYLFSSDDRVRNFRKAVINKLRGFSGTVFLAGEQIWDVNRSFQEYNPIIIPFSEISYKMRRDLWSTFLKESKLQDGILDDLTNKFTFTPSQIINAITASKKLSSFNNKKKDPLTIDDVYKGCFQEMSKGLRTFGHKINAKYSWDDLILSRDKKSQLSEIISHVKNKNKVFNEWGFESKLSLGKGLNILFTGESGTGKTMTAEIISNELKLDLYKIDLSTTVSKYIGETEKNLSTIFKEAKSSNSIIFFDEADAIFGKRTEVKDAHDRYANTEINYLLQMIEEHEEIVILASNLAQNIDDAFIRRMRFRIDFPFPNEYSRFKIWENIFPKTAPISSNIEFDFLAKQFVISGGVIKNIALSSAFFAAEENTKITMKHIIIGIGREFEKIGKPCLKSDFGKYYDFIKG